MTQPEGFASVRLFPVGGDGPEDVVLDPEGRVHTGLEDGRIVRLDPSDGAVVTVARVPGRPLGLELLGAGELLVCASDAGLLSVALDDGAVRTFVDRFDGRRLGAVNNATDRRRGDRLVHRFLHPLPDPPLARGPGAAQSYRQALPA